MFTLLNKKCELTWPLSMTKDNTEQVTRHHIHLPGCRVPAPLLPSSGCLWVTVTSSRPVLSLYFLVSSIDWKEHQKSSKNLVFNIHKTVRIFHSSYFFWFSWLISLHIIWVSSLYTGNKFLEYLFMTRVSSTHILTSFM